MNPYGNSFYGGFSLVFTVLYEVLRAGRANLGIFDRFYNVYFTLYCLWKFGYGCTQIGIFGGFSSDFIWSSERAVCN